MANNLSYYFHKQNWSIDTTPPGRRIGTLTALVISAVMGLLFVVFLPVIGFVLAGKALLKKTTGLVKPVFQTSVSPIAPLGEAHLTGSPGSSEPTLTHSYDETLDELAKEIQERRVQR